MTDKNLNNDYTTTQLTALVILRMMIGWHLLYEGLTLFTCVLLKYYQRG